MCCMDTKYIDKIHNINVNKTHQLIHLTIMTKKFSPATIP